MTEKRTAPRNIALLGLVSLLFCWQCGELVLPGGWMHEIRQIPIVDARYAACWKSVEAKGKNLGWVEIIEVDGQTAWKAAIMTPDNSFGGVISIHCAYGVGQAQTVFLPSQR